LHSLHKLVELAIDLVASLPFLLLFLYFVRVVPFRWVGVVGMQANMDTIFVCAASLPCRAAASRTGGNADPPLAASHGAPACVQRLHRVHNLRVKLHIVGFLLANHDGVDQVEVHQRNHLIVGGLEKGMLDVAAGMINKATEMADRGWVEA
jgi:hypothetical protein